MSYVRWDPWKRIGFLQNRINGLIAESASDPRIADDEISRCEWKPAVDILDTAKGVVIKADLPGVKKENVSVELKDNLMTLKGERTADLPVESDKCYRRERCFGSFFRAFTLPGRVIAGDVRAVLKDGVLEICLSRPENEKPRQIHIHVN
jgi:HSP20 family protein